MCNCFIARKWSESKGVEKPYDVVYQDFTNNNLHYHPDLSFARLVDAEKEVQKLNAEKSAVLAKQWPIDGPVIELKQVLAS